MEIDQIRAFVALAQSKNFSKAAEQLHLVQSSVSTRIRVLEETVGRPLFTRNNRHVKLTPAGEKLLPYARRILTLEEEGLVKVRSLGVFSDKISVGATDSLWRHLVRPVLLDFAAKHPDISLLTKTGHSWEVIQFLMDDVIQLGFVYARPSLPGVEVVTLYEDDILLVAGKRFKAPEDPVSKADLAKLPYITLEWDGPLHAWTRSVLPRDYFPQIQLDQLSMLVTFLLKGMGVAFVPKRTVEAELARGDLVELKLGKDIKPPRRKYYAIYRQDRGESAVIQLWTKLLKQHGFRLS